MELLKQLEGGLRKQRSNLKFWAVKKQIKFPTIFLISIMFIFTTSCLSIKQVSHDEGNHNGWYKNPNNPHNPNTTKIDKQPSKAEKEAKKK